MISKLKIFQLPGRGFESDKKIDSPRMPRPPEYQRNFLGHPNTVNARLSAPSIKRPQNMVGGQINAPLNKRPPQKCIVFYGVFLFNENNLIFYTL